jgi:hypothetical protein
MMDIRDFAGRHLADIIDVTTGVKPDPQHTSNGFEAHAEIISPFNRYRMSVHSSHLAPPAGAPTECRSLGTVIFHDPATDTQIVGARSDQTLIDISRHVHHREYTDKIAHARRELAEAGPDVIKARQEKLGSLVSAGAKWGVSGSVPMAPSTKDTEPLAVPSTASLAPDTVPPTAAAAVPSLTLRAVLDESQPFVGAPVIFITNPGEQISGMQELPAIIVRVDARRQTVCLLVFIDDSETVHRLNIPRRGSDAGNGRVHKHSCWDFNPVYARERAQAEADGKRLAELGAAIDALAAENKQLVDRIAALEAKPKRGRPAKLEAGEAEGSEPAAEGEAAKDSEFALTD